MVDGAFTVARRMLSGKSPFHGDKKHLHHLLLKRGWSQRSIALFYWSISAILGAAALLLDSKGKAFTICMLVAVVVMVLLFLHLNREDEHEKNNSAV